MDLEKLKNMDSYIESYEVEKDIEALADQIKDTCDLDKALKAFRVKENKKLLLGFLQKKGVVGRLLIQSGQNLIEIFYLFNAIDMWKPLEKKELNQNTELLLEAALHEDYHFENVIKAGKRSTLIFLGFLPMKEVKKSF